MVYSQSNIFTITGKYEILCYKNPIKGKMYVTINFVLLIFWTPSGCLELLILYAYRMVV